MGREWDDKKAHRGPMIGNESFVRYGRIFTTGGPDSFWGTTIGSLEWRDHDGGGPSATIDAATDGAVCLYMLARAPSKANVIT